MDIVPIDPLILQCRVSLPLDQVLYLVLSAVFSRLDDFLNFVFFFPIDKVRWWSCEIWSVELGFMIRGQQVCMENVMYLPLRQKLQLISDRR